MLYKKEKKTITCVYACTEKIHHLSLPWAIQVRGSILKEASLRERGRILLLTCYLSHLQ